MWHPVSLRMSVLLFSLLILLATGSEGASKTPPRQPDCSGMAQFGACPLVMAPVCGTDNITYDNECSLCVERLSSKTNILIAYDGSC